jgi:hypothetical protein
MEKKFTSTELESILKELYSFFSPKNLEKEITNLLKKPQYRINPVTEEFEVIASIDIKRTRKRVRR